jgi:hypothetical protein
MADDIFDSARRLRQRSASVQDQLDLMEDVQDATGDVPSPPASTRGVTAEQALRTRHTGEEGEPAFGAPVARPEVSKESREEAIRKAQDERIAALNVRAQEQRQAQSTDSNN